MDLLLAVHFLLVQPMAVPAREDLVAVMAILTLLQLVMNGQSRSSNYSITFEHLATER